MTYQKPHLGAPKSVAVETLKYPKRRRASWSIPYPVIAPIAMVSDTLLIVLVSVIGSDFYHYVYYSDGAVGRPADTLQTAALGIVVAALFVGISKARDLYEPVELLNLKSQIQEVSLNWFVVLLFLAAAAFAMKAGANFSRGSTFLFSGIGLIALLGERVFWRVALADGLAVRRFSGRRIVLITEPDAVREAGILEALDRHGLQPTHHFMLPGDPDDIQGQKRVITKAITTMRGSHTEEIIVAADLDHWSKLKDVISELRILPIPVNLVPIGKTSELFHLPSHTIGETITIELQRRPRTLFERGIKRMLDLIFVTCALILLVPLFVMTAIAIKLDSPGPVFFWQRRSGFNGRKFYIMKFRTMSVLEDGETVTQAKPKDSRVTRVGYWLRRTSIDELPQLFNVLVGHMSVIGPRPHALAHDTEFGKLVAKYAYRHHVKPGITGWAQINGFRGRTCTVADIEKRLALDLWYIDNWNLALDLKISLMTMIEVVRGENAY